MKYLTDLKSILIIGLIGLVIFSQFYSCDDQPLPEPIHIIDTVYQDVKVEVPVYVPKWRTKIKEVEVPGQTIPAKIDTAEILADYYAKYKTIDTLKLTYKDTANVERKFGYGVLTDIISRNQIIERGIVWNYRIPTIRETIIIPAKPVNQYFIGATAGFNSKTFVDNVSAGFILKTKKDKVYQASLGLGNRGGTIQPFVGGGIYWKIQLRKPKIKVGDLIGH